MECARCTLRSGSARIQLDKEGVQLISTSSWRCSNSGSLLEMAMLDDFLDRIDRLL